MTISIHALREEGDNYTTDLINETSIFLSTPSARRATVILRRKGYEGAFLSTPSARRATADRGREDDRQKISLHALREEGDEPASSVLELDQNFYPRPPRGGRRSIGPNAPVSSLFLSTPSARRATAQLVIHGLVGDHISIHALREEGDGLERRNAGRLFRFLSTPSARRATIRSQISFHSVEISIHALREEGDWLLRLLPR